MELVKWNGGTPAFSGLLDEFFNRELDPIVGRLTKNAPSVNIRETDKSFILEVAAPGMTREDFNIEVEPENRLIISSEKKQENEKTEKGRFTLQEFSYSSFRRSFNLPDSVDSDQIHASYKNGLLILELPKRPEALPKPARKIEIR